MKWKIIGSSVRGFQHQTEGIPCQDACGWCVHYDWLFAVVSDGAGSAPQSEQGSRHAADFIPNHLKLAIASLPSSSLVNFWQKKITEAIEKARQAILNRSKISLKEYHATLVGLVAGPDFSLFFHLGDGLGAAVANKQWDPCVLSTPENGLYVEETFFYTQDNWKEHLRFTPVTDSVNLYLLMSDGTASFAVTKNQQGLDEKFFAPVDKYLQSIDTETGGHALTKTLEDPRIRNITGDDKTLIWIQRNGS